MIRYKMFEREITKGNHRSYHVCVDKFGGNFHPNSKHYPIDEALSDIDLDYSSYECNITVANHTSPGDYFHISYLMKDRKLRYLQRDVLDAFNVPVRFNVLYFTRKYPFEDGFKCGFDLVTYRSFKSKLFNKSMDLIKKFNGNYNAIIFAGDFTKDGEFIDDSINVEIIPYQTKDIFYSTKNILLDNFDIDIDKINLYDRMFKDYTIENFSWHTKVKFFENGDSVVKFYRTYPKNPFINYGNYV